MCMKRGSVNALIIHFHELIRVRVDSCMRPLIMSLTNHGYNTVACCCGHGIYPMTIICQVDKQKRFYDLISGIDVPRTRNFYRLDSKGYYYIPEVVDER